MTQDKNHKTKGERQRQETKDKIQKTGERRQKTKDNVT